MMVDHFDGMAESRAWFDLDDARQHRDERRLERGQEVVASVSEERQTSPAAKAPNLRPEGSPIWHGYQVAIPEGWSALAVAFCQDPDAPDGSMPQDSLAAVRAEMRRFAAGVLLCRPGTDGPTVVQEFLADASPEAAYLGQDGQYLRAARERPAYGVVLLDRTSRNRSDQSAQPECLVLLPCLPIPGESDAMIARPRLFCDGVEVRAPDLDFLNSKEVS